MNTSLETARPEQNLSTRAKKHHNSQRKTSIWLYFLLVILWLGLIAGGLYEAKNYMDHMRSTIEQQVTQQVSQQTTAQLKTMQDNYQNQLDSFKKQTTTNIANLQKKIDTLNQLLTFIKDSTSTKTNNSNQLYTQLQSVQKQLDELKKNLDVLK